MGLLPAIFFAELWYFGFNPGKSWWELPFITISFMGFFGGGVSAILIARENVMGTPDRTEIEGQLTLRMLIGASGALVVYIILGSGLFASDFSILVHENIYVFLLIGIVAGFSEQLFIGALGRMSEKLNIV